MTTKVSYAALWPQFALSIDWAMWTRHIHFMHDEEPVKWGKDAYVTAGSLATEFLQFQLWTGGVENELTQYCLNRAQYLMGEVMCREAFNTDLGPTPHPRQQFFYEKALWDAFLSTAGQFDADTVRRIAVDELEMSRDVSAPYWDDVAQRGYLRTIELLLLVDDYPMAQELLGLSRTMVRTKAAPQVIKALAKSRGTKLTDAHRAAFREAFDRLREPTQAPPPGGIRLAHAFHELLIMACIWQKFMEPGDGSYSLHRAFDLVRA